MQSKRVNRRRRTTLLTLLGGTVVVLLVVAFNAQASFGALSSDSTVASAVTPGPRTTGDLGVTFGFKDSTVNGGPYTNPNPIYNLPMYKSDGNSDHFWDNYVEELGYAGVDYVAPTIRGHLGDKPQYDANGDPGRLTGLVNAITRAGSKLKVSALDDTAASLDAMKNAEKHGSYVGNPPYDMSDKTGAGEGGYQYMWQNNLELWFKTVPKSMWYTIDGRPVIWEWSIASDFVVNGGNGNAAALLKYVKAQAQAEFGVNPFIIVDSSWLKVDPTVAQVADGEHQWFTLTNHYTLTSFNGRKFGVAAPGFNVVDSTTNMNIDPGHGQTLDSDMTGTVGAGADTTLVEGYSDWPENAAMWRAEPGTYAQRRYDYPNQMIDILRKWSKDPYPANMQVQAESADAYSDTTPGNAYNKYRDGDIDVMQLADGSSTHGWNVGNVATGEWLSWQAVPLSGTVNLKVRMSTPLTGRQIRFTVDGKPGPVTTLTTTGSWNSYAVASAGTFTNLTAGPHTVRIDFLNGLVNLDWWSN